MIAYVDRDPELFLHPPSWLVRTVPPAIEPVTLADVQEHLDLTEDTQTGMDLDMLIQAAREMVESKTNGCLIEQTWQQSLDEWPSQDYIKLRRGPILELSSVTYKLSDGSVLTLPGTDYTLDSKRKPARVTLNNDKSWPSATLHTVNPITITLKAGYGATPETVPARLRHAMRVLVRHWYDNPAAVAIGQTTTIMTVVPMGFDSLIDDYCQPFQ